MIRIQNIYHMLAYAFQVLREQGYAKVATEEFDNTAELMAAILTRSIDTQLKRGLGREYIEHTSELSSLHGKIEITESVKTRAVLRRQMVCSYDEFSIDTHMNQILKATCLLLIKSDIKKQQKKELKKLLAYFSDVSDINLTSVDWHMRFNRNNQTYQMLMNVCWLVAKGLLQTEDDGTTRLANYLDEQRMCRLYEKFILEYYKRHHKELSAEASYIKWKLDDGFDDMLPTMQSDITLAKGNSFLIIDAKYYEHTAQQQFNKRTIHSSNLYQIFTYVKNKEAELSVTPHKVSGMLLYAKTDEEIQPEGSYQMSGNQISVKTLDLNIPFNEIRAQLDEIAETHFPEETASN